MTNCSSRVEPSFPAVTKRYLPGSSTNSRLPSSESGPPAMKSKSSEVQDVKPLESGGHSSLYFASTTPIQLLSGSSHSNFMLISSSMNAGGTSKSSPVIPTGQPTESSVQGTIGTSVREFSTFIPTRLPRTNNMQRPPTRPGSIDNILTIFI